MGVFASLLIVRSGTEDIYDTFFFVDGVNNAVFQGQAHRPAAFEVSNELLSVERVYGNAVHQYFVEFFLELRRQGCNVFLRSPGDQNLKRFVSHCPKFVQRKRYGPP